MLRAVYNPHLADRRSEGEQFVPPEASLDYVQKLRDLVKEEGVVQEERKKHFLSKGFRVDDAGELFPSSWRASIGITREGTVGSPSSKKRWVPSDAEVSRLEPVIASTTPMFDKSTEDGTRFRIYQVDSLDVRTTQEHDGEEVMGAIFSDRTPVRTAKAASVKDAEQIVKATQYVESTAAADADEQKDKGPNPSRAPRKPVAPDRHHYVVLETAAGGVLVTEKLGSKVLLAENPKDLDARNCLAKVVSRVDCQSVRVKARDIRGLQASWDSAAGSTASRSECKRYAQEVFALALPAREKSWAALTESQRLAAEQLGISGAQVWDKGTSQVWRQQWTKLTVLQRMAAQDLGLDEATWARMHAEAKVWASLTEGERDTAKDLGVADEQAWDARTAPVWAKAWGRMAVWEKAAASQLGFDNISWDTVRTVTGSM